MVVLPKGKEGEGQCRVHLDPAALLLPIKAGATVGRLSFYFKGKRWIGLNCTHGSGSSATTGGGGYGEAIG